MFFVRGGNQRPVCPKPPAPRSVAVREEAFRKRGDAIGLEDQLRNALASLNSSWFGGRIQKVNGDFPRVVGINDTHALGHDDAVSGPESAA